MKTTLVIFYIKLCCKRNKYIFEKSKQYTLGDTLASLNSSKNYRTIAIISLLLKLLDWIILILFGAKLGIDDLQFAYQPGVSAMDGYRHC